MPEERITYNPCQGWGCHEKCILETHTVDGKIVRTQRSQLPGFVGVGNQICQKGISSKKIPYNDKRLLHPLKRVGERGEGKFEEITWDQALDEICAIISKDAEEYGHRSIIVNGFYCGCPGNRSSISDILCNRFLNVYGANKFEYEAVDYAIVQQDVADTGMPFVAGRNNILNADNLVIIWGGNPIGFTRPARVTRMLLDAQERGAKIVHISNLFDNTSAKADEWVPVKSATDAGLALAMANVIVRDGLVNMDFMMDETAGPLLVRTDTGKFLRESDLSENGSPFMYAVYDEKTGKVAFTPRQEKRHSGFGDLKPAIEAEGEIDGIPYKSSYTLLLEHLAKWTPEYQEQFTGVPAETVEHLAHLYVESSPSLICIGDGLRYSNGTQTIRAIKLLTYLSGNYGAPHGGTIMTAGIDDEGVSAIDHNFLIYDPTFPPDNAEMPSLTTILESFEDPSKQQYKVFINALGNPLLNWPNKELWRKRLLPHFDLVVSFEIRMTDTCRYADYVLPEATAFERHEVITETDNTIVLCEPAIEPQGESRTAADIWRGIAERLGIGEYFQKTQEEWARAIVDGQPGGINVFPDVKHGGATGAEEPVPLSYDMLKEKKAIHMALPDVPVDFYASFEMFPNETGRIQFYSEAYSECDSAMADLADTWILDEEDKKKYPLHFFIARHKYFMQAQFTNIPEMEALAESQFGVALNPVDAQARGLKDGDTIEVYNQRGTMKTKLQLREDVAPGVCHTWYSYDETYYPDNCTPQDLATPQNAPETSTPMAVVNGKRWQATLTAAGAPKTAMFIAGETTPEVIFDQLCEVRKAE